MKAWYDKENEMGDVIPFKIPHRETTIEHVDSTTIVERSIMTDEQREMFEDAYIDALERAEKDPDPPQDWNPGVPS